MSQTRLRTRRDPGGDPGPGALARVTGAFTTLPGLLALVVVAVQAWWRGRELVDGYFTQDDFVLLQRVQGSVDLDLLLEEFAGELSPVGHLLAWAVAQGGARDWGTVVVVVLGLQALAALLLWLVLSRLLEDRWVRLPLFAVACFTPLTLASTMWWSLALMHLPTVVLLLVALLALLARIQDGWQSGHAVAGGALVLALLCSSHALLLPLVLFFVAAGVSAERASGEPLRVRSRLAGAARQHAVLWVWLLLAVVARIVLEVRVLGNRFGWPDQDGTASDVVEQFARQGIAGLVGGPWSGEVLTTVLAPQANWPLGVAALVCLLLAAPVLRAGHPVARVGLLGLITYFACGAVFLVLNQEGVGVLGVTSRFLADLAVVVVVLLAVALRKTPVPTEISAAVAAVPGVLAVLLAAGYAASAAVTTSQLVPELRNTDDRAYVDNIADGLDLDPRVVLLDGAPPEGVLSNLFGDRARISTVTSTMPQDPAFDAPSAHLRIVDQAGYVRAIDLFEAVEAEPGRDEDCGHPVRSRPRVVRMVERVPDGRQVMRVGFYTRGETFAEVELPDGPRRFPARTGVHVVEFPVEQGFDEFTLSLESPDQTVCLTSVEVGVPVPAPLPSS